MVTRMLLCLNYRFYARPAARAPGMALWIMLVGVLALHANAASASCAAPANPIEAENCQPGTDYHQWLLDGDGDTTIQGYATDSSVNVGQAINFKINTTATAYSAWAPTVDSARARLLPSTLPQRCRKSNRRAYRTPRPTFTIAAPGPYR